MLHDTWAYYAALLQFLLFRRHIGSCTVLQGAARVHVYRCVGSYVTARRNMLQQPRSHQRHMLLFNGDECAACMYAQATVIP